MRTLTHDSVSTDFPTGKFSIRNQEAVGEYSSGFGDL
jgi:hypothetical protein